MKFDQVEFDIGSRYLSALINGDFSGLEDEEAKLFDVWETNVRTSCGNVGHWAALDDSNEFGCCDVTGLRGDVTKVAYMFPTGD